MKNLLKISLAAFVSTFASCAFSMQVNYGIIASYDCTVSTYKFINGGKITGLNGVKIDVSSFTGNGLVSGANYVDIKAVAFGYSGSITAGKKCAIKAVTFEKDATIESPEITIVCDEFKFEGTLNCSGKCTIYAKKSFDTTMFKRLGKGTFKVVISPHDVQFFSQEGLISKFSENFYTTCLTFDEKTAVDSIKKIRTHAILNILNDKEVLHAIKNNLEKKASFHRNKLVEKQDADSLRSGLGKCGLTAAGLTAACLTYTNAVRLAATCKAEVAVIKVASAIMAGLSAFPAVYSYDDFYNWLNPRHQEKYEKLSLLISRIDYALATERVSEELIIAL